MERKPHIAVTSLAMHFLTKYDLAYKLSIHFFMSEDMVQIEHEQIKKMFA